jgi:hypothetical protein
MRRGENAVREVMGREWGGQGKRVGQKKKKKNSTV